MMRSMSSASSASSLLRLFVITVVVVGTAFILVREIIIPAFINYQYGLLGSSEFTIRNSETDTGTWIIHATTPSER
jgi:hypothetical protein